MRLKLLSATCLLVAFASSAAALAAPFDGNWSVVIVTEQGDCDRAYRYPVTIENGSVRYGGDADFEASGKVDAKGAVEVRIRRGKQGADGKGQLGQDSGSGTWKSAGGECRGSWTAEKRG